jgi:hypothetical protein
LYGVFGVTSVTSGYFGRIYYQLKINFIIDYSVAADAAMDNPTKQMLCRTYSILKVKAKSRISNGEVRDIRRAKKVGDIRRAKGFCYFNVSSM